MNTLAQMFIGEDALPKKLNLGIGSLSFGQESDKLLAEGANSYGVMGYSSMVTTTPLRIALSSPENSSGASLASSYDPNNYTTVATNSPLGNRVDNYLWEDINNIIPSSKLQEALQSYEVKYAMPSNEFYSKWIDGKISSNPDTHNWLNLYLLLSP